jgi:methyl-accepting chemotaxis protein
MTKLNFRDKLLVFGIALTVCLLVLFAGVMWRQYGQLREAAYKGFLKATEADMDHTAESVYQLCENSRGALERNIREHLRAAREVLNEAGGIQIDKGMTVDWEARRELSGAVSKISLPRLLAGEEWLGQISEPEMPVPALDAAKTLTNAASTIFQRMNADGDMLRVATNVIANDGKRAIGTYIPAVGSDGKPDPVISTILRGETFVARASISDAWYMTAYEPLFDSDKQVIGMLYTGLPESAATASLRHTIMSTKVGRTGYIFVVNAQGATRGHYVISKGGQRDGEDVWNTQDTNGNFPIQEICRRAVALAPGESVTERYLWQNPPGSQPQANIVRLKYFKDWDWVIGVTEPENELYETATAIDQISHAGARTFLWAGSSALALSCVVWFFLATGLTRRTSRIVQKLRETSAAVSQAAAQVSAGNMEWAREARAHSTSNESVTSSLDQMRSMTQRSLDHSRELKQLAGEARGSAEDGALQVRSMTETMTQIQSAGSEVVKINKLIDEIAFQTNILALNAAIEAARAGEAGLGFAVVAEEVRNLAQRCAAAAHETSEKIRKSMSASEEGVSMTRQVAEKLQAITAATRKLDDLAQAVATASEQQNQGIAHVDEAANEMSQAIQSASVNSEQGAQHANQFGAQARILENLSSELSQLFQKRSDDSAALPAPAVPLSPQAQLAGTRNEPQATRGRSKPNRPAASGATASRPAPTGRGSKHQRRVAAQPTQASSNRKVELQAHGGPTGLTQRPNRQQ